jgi:hypothetical protein
LKRVASAILWLAAGVALGAGLYSALQHAFQLSSVLVLVVASIPAFLAWALDSYKKALEICKLHQEIGKLSREAKKDQESSNLVQRVSAELPQGFTPPYGERDRVYIAVKGQERLTSKFDFKSPGEP